MLLARKGIPERKQSMYLAEITGLSYPQALRKLSGGAGWEVDDLAQVCVKLGEPLVDALREAFPARMVAAQLLIGDAWAPCEVELGEPVAERARLPLVAVRDASAWRVGPPARLPAGGTARRIRRLELVPPPERRYRIAVFDDQVDVCDTLVELLEGRGFEATAFYDGPAFERGIGASAFDGFLIDWIVPGTDVAAVMRRLRQRWPAAPIAVVSGKVESGEADEDALARALAECDASFFAKPAPIGLIAAALRRGLETSPGA